MADNYLENKFDQLQKARKVVVKRNNPSLDTLLHKNRSHVDLGRKSLKTIKLRMESLVQFTYGSKLFITPKSLGLTALKIIVRNITAINLVRIIQSKRIGRFYRRIEL